MSMGFENRNLLIATLEELGGYFDTFFWAGIVLSSPVLQMKHSQNHIICLGLHSFQRENLDMNLAVNAW